MRIMLQYGHSRANIYFKMKLSSFEINYLNFCVCKGMIVLCTRWPLSHPVSAAAGPVPRFGASPLQVPSPGLPPVEARTPEPRLADEGPTCEAWRGREPPGDGQGQVPSSHGTSAPWFQAGRAPSVPRVGQDTPGGRLHSLGVCRVHSVWRNGSDRPSPELRVEPPEGWAVGAAVGTRPEGGSSQPPGAATTAGCVRGLPPVAASAAAPADADRHTPSLPEERPAAPQHPQAAGSAPPGPPRGVGGQGLLEGGLGPAST